MSNELRSPKAAEMRDTIPVEIVIKRFNVPEEVAQIVRCYPTLSYMLGATRFAPEIEPDRFGPVSLAVEGSALYGLADPVDTLRWSGIANHVFGSARHVFFLAQRLASLSPRDRLRFGEFGYDISDFEDIDPVLLRDFALLSHSGRRVADETRQYNLNDEVHKQPHIGKATVEHLQRERADEYFIELARVENDVVLRAQKVGRGYLFPSILDNLLTYADWTFDQKPTGLASRFLYLHARQREKSPVLDVLQECGVRFEEALIDILGQSVLDEMMGQAIPEWEMEIRAGYVSYSGLSLEEVFPLLSK